MTLELPDEVLQRAHVVADRTGRGLEQVLADWIRRGADQDAESLLVSGVEYPIYTPLGNEAAAQALLDALKAHKQKRDDE